MNKKDKPCKTCGGSGWVEDDGHGIIMSGAEMERLDNPPIRPEPCPKGCNPESVELEEKSC